MTDIPKEILDELCRLPLELLAEILNFLPINESESLFVSLKLSKSELDSLDDLLFAVAPERTTSDNFIMYGSIRATHIEIFKRDVLHSQTQPALITHDHIMNTKEERWYYKGQTHRSYGLPAVIFVDITDKLNPKCLYHEYFENDVWHRVDGPAKEHFVYEFLTSYWYRGVRYQTPELPLKPNWWLTTPVYVNRPRDEFIAKYTQSLETNPQSQPTTQGSKWRHLIHSRDEF